MDAENDEELALQVSNGELDPDAPSLQKSEWIRLVKEVQAEEER